MGLSAHQMAPAGVVPHSSSSEVSAHQMPARDDLYSTSYKDLERKCAGPHDVSDAPPPNLHFLLNEVCHGAWDCWARRENHWAASSSCITGVRRGAQLEACADPCFAL